MPAKPLRILFIEDHISTNEVLTRMLRNEGHTVWSAESGHAARRLVDEGHAFDLVISDLGLPDTSGWELLPHLQNKLPELRAIALTGYGYPPDIQRSEEAGFDLHLVKPPEWPRIRQAIAELFGGG